MRSLGPRPLVLGAHYLLDVVSDRLVRGAAPDEPLDEVFGAARTLGAVAVRTLASRIAGDPARSLPGPDGALGAVALEALARIVRAAGRHHVGLVLSLGNGWNDYGGTRGEVALAGLPDPVEQDPRFFLHPAVRRLRRRFVERLLTHEIDGTPLGRHPVVLAWEPLNEPRPRLDREGRAVRAWLEAEVGTIRRMAPDSTIASGEEGLDVSFVERDEALYRSAGAGHLFGHRTSYRRNLDCPGLDWASVHVYPEAWGVPRARRAEVGIHFVREAARLARRAGKRLFVGELGGDEDRWELVLPIVRAAHAEGAVVGLWMLRAETAPRHHDRYAFGVDEARAALRELAR